MKQALYFGCIGESGHYLHSLTGRRQTFTPAHFPWRIGDMDTGLLKAVNRRDIYDGRVFWTFAGNWFAFYWWDNSVDTRAGSNSGFYVSDFIRCAEAFDFACAAWPDVVARQRHPLKLVNVP